MNDFDHRWRELTARARASGEPALPPAPLHLAGQRRALAPTQLRRFAPWCAAAAACLAALALLPYALGPAPSSVLTAWLPADGQPTVIPGVRLPRPPRLESPSHYLAAVRAALTEPRP